jgi:uncharacterized protein (DUF983 family)
LAAILGAVGGILFVIVIAVVGIILVLIVVMVAKKENLNIWIQTRKVSLWISHILLICLQKFCSILMLPETCRKLMVVSKQDV